MLTTLVKPVAAGDERAAIDAIVLAFVADPMTRWTWPHPHQYLGAMPDLSRAFAGAAFTNGGADCTNGCSGAALWLGPGVHPDTARMDEIFGRTASSEARKHMPSLFEQMKTYHPEEPRWYLPLIGVDPARQGHGLGDALMTYAVARCDRERLPAYLESSNPRNISLYRRHGFVEMGTIQAGSSPTVVPMLRRAR